MTVTTSQVPGRHLQKHSETGAAAIALSADAKRPGRLESVSLLLSAAPTTSENFTITLNALAGATYDVLLLTRDLSVDSTSELFWQPDTPIWLETGDVIDVAYANTDTGTYGVQATLLEML